MYTIKDFLFKTQFCKNCNELMNLNIHATHNENYLIDKSSIVDFDICDDLLLIYINHKYNQKMSSHIIVNIKLHSYTSSNIDNSCNIVFHRECFVCKKYALYTQKLIFSKLINLIQINFIELMLQHDRSEYIITKNFYNENCNVAVSPSGSNWKMPIDIIKSSREEIIKKISRYEILQ